jgi:myo-inositol-1(or 4)-monophosphatase
MPLSYLEAADEIAREAGTVLSDYLDRHIGFELKGDFDLVTAADRASEKLVVERLSKLFPDHAILAEEGGGHESRSGYCWYVDPLDGTTNFAHGYPVFNVTLGLEKDGEMIAGVIYDPTRDEMFAAEKGGGAALNGARIHVSKAARLSDSLVATGFPSRKRHFNINIHFYHQLAMATHGVRRGGAAAIDLAYVACGRLEAFWEFGLNPWDMAAGVLLVSEAGGAVSTMKGEPHDLRSPHLLVDNSLIHSETVGLFGEVFRGEYRFPMPVIQPA